MYSYPSSGVRVTGSCVLPSMFAGNQIWATCKNSYILLTTEPSLGPLTFTKYIFIFIYVYVRHMAV